jgi:hypothetical protein
MSIFLRLLTAIIITTSVFAQTPSVERPLMGFTAESSAHQRALEARFDASLKADDLRDWMKRLSARPHHVGSAYDKENAEFIAGLLRSWGYDTNIEEFQVLFPTPKTRLVEMTAPEKFTLKLNEPTLKEDATSGQQDEQLPTYNAYSIDGDVTGQLVSGDIWIRDALKSVSLNTVSGDVRVDAALEGVVQVNAISGDIHVGVRRGSSVYVDCNTISGSMNSELELSDSPSQAGEPGPQLEVRAKTVSGDVLLTRASAPAPLPGA